MMENLMNIQNLQKSFKGNCVLKDLSFTVQPGEILCILGPNGAGKTTTINMRIYTISVSRHRRQTFPCPWSI